MTNITLERASITDVPFMEQRLYEAATRSIPEEQRPPFERTMTYHWFNRYILGWGREDDCGLIAKDGSDPVGAAWYRAYPETDNKFLQPMTNTPLPPHELAIGLIAPARGKGIGTLILRGLLDEAINQNVTELCLCVNPDNIAARRLYQNVGFEVVGAGWKSEVMLWEA